MATPVEHAEALALSMVTRGEGKHRIDGNPEFLEATVQFSTGELGVVEVTLLSEKQPPQVFRFAIAAPRIAPPAREEGSVLSCSRPTEADIVRLRQATELRPEDSEAWNELGGALLALGRCEEAILPLEKAVALKPCAIYRLELGMCYSAAGRHGDAEKCLENVAALDPKLSRWVSHPGAVALIKLAHARWKQGQAASAVETLLPAIPLVAGILRDLGAYCMDAGRHHDAVKFLCAAGGIAPDMEDALHGAGRALLWLGRSEEAVPWLTEAVTADETCVQGWYDLGLALSRMGKRAEARRMFRRALKRDPNHAGSWYDLGCQDALDRKMAAAFRNLNRAAQCGWNRVAHAQSDPDLVELRKDKRWPALVASMQQAGSIGQPAAPPY